jgi:hypothetical protein
MHYHQLVMRRTTFLGIWLLATISLCITTYFYYSHNHSQGMAVIADIFIALIVLLIAMIVVDFKK